jgi:hypothetical protein
MSKIVSARELSDTLSIPVKTIYKRARLDNWPVYRVGRDVRFDLDEILALIRDRGDS